MRLCNAIHKLRAALFQKLQFIVEPSGQREQTNCQCNAFDIAAQELLYMLIQMLFAIKWKCYRLRHHKQDKKYFWL